MPNIQSTAIEFKDDGTALVDGRAPVSVLLDDLCSLIDSFVLRVRGCVKNEEGDFLTRDPKAGRLRGLEILWSNVTICAAAAQAKLLGVNDVQRESIGSGDSVRLEVLQHRRSDLPLGDALRQIIFMLAEERGVFPEGIRESDLERLRSIRASLHGLLPAPHRDIPADEQQVAADSPVACSRGEMHVTNRTAVGSSMLPTLSDLCVEAGVSKDVFQDVRRAAGINLKLTGRAASRYRYSPQQVEQLRQAALGGGFTERVGMYTKWEKYSVNSTEGRNNDGSTR